MKKASDFKNLLTVGIWDEYSLMKCQLEVPFKSLVYPGIMYPNDEYRLCASSLSCYKFYNKLFENYLNK